MRHVILDTETTGLDPSIGHRIVELACVEMLNRRVTDNHFHHYVNPERKSDEAAFNVHGIADETLLDKPKFAEIADHFLQYVKGAEVIIHNAAFDIAFLNAELVRAGFKRIEEYCNITCSLTLAKKMHPGKRNNLDALCERYTVDRSTRVKHGALIDVHLLASVYLAMTRGQESLLSINTVETLVNNTSIHANQRFKVITPSVEEEELHTRYLSDLDPIAADKSTNKSIWHLLNERESTESISSIAS